MNQYSVLPYSLSISQTILLLCHKTVMKNCNWLKFCLHLLPLALWFSGAPSTPYWGNCARPSAGEMTEGVMVFHGKILWTPEIFRARTIIFGGFADPNGSFADLFEKGGRISSLGMNTLLWSYHHPEMDQDFSAVSCVNVTAQHPSLNGQSWDLRPIYGFQE